jgi:hypothetical protein
MRMITFMGLQLCKRAARKLLPKVYLFLFLLEHQNNSNKKQDLLVYTVLPFLCDSVSFRSF